MAEDRAPGLPTIDTNEYGGKKDGERQVANRRLFMQLLVFEPDTDETQKLVHALEARKIPSVLYADVSDPRALGLLTWSEDPAHFVDNVRPLFTRELAGATMRNDFAMLGRTYSTGHEPDLLDSLLARPVRNALNPKLGWHVWYPLRRSGAFSRLEGPQVAELMREHAMIGHAYGQQDLASDIRLACHGLDAKDNEFVIGLVSDELHPLSHLVQAMRKTKQTSEFIVQMGPFFVGRVIHRVAV